jgi:adenosylcobyric acid synthase
MNPVLLKPGSDMRSHVVVMGEPAGALDAYEFAGSRRPLADAAHAAFDSLSSRYDVVVCEGAGSPTEINLRPHDYVNMGLAQHASMPVVVVGDIDRGGVFASLFGTVALMPPEDQALVAGFIINKFRGDVSLLGPGLRRLEELTGRTAYGVLPWLPSIWLDSEDTLDFGGTPAGADGAGGRLRVGVLRFPRISNFTDVDALALEPGVEVSYVDSPRHLVGQDLLVLPGTRSTIADLAWLRARGLDHGIRAHAAAGRPLLGICGGYQMLGESIADPDGVESPAGSAAGLSLLPVETVFTSDKTVGLTDGIALSERVSGYEIHHGSVTPCHGAVEPFLEGVCFGSVYGTVWHGAFENDGFRRAWLSRVAAVAGSDWTPSTAAHGFADRREARIDLIADAIEKHLDVDKLMGLVTNGAPLGLPRLPPA